MQEENIATDGLEPTSTSPAQVALCRSKMKGAVSFGYSIMMTVFSMNNAFATGSFSAIISAHSFNQSAVFGMSAILEGSGLAIGACMSILAYFKANERSLWGDLLSEPYMILLKGLVGEGERGRTLVWAGVFGTMCQAMLACAPSITISIRNAKSEGLSETELLLHTGGALACSFLILGWFFYILVSVAGRIDYAQILAVVLVFSSASMPLFVEVWEVFYLTRSSFSAESCTLIVMDVLAIVSLSIVTSAFVLAVSFLFLGHAVYVLTRLCCPSSCREPVECLNPKRSVPFLAKQLARINLVKPEETERRPASPDANASPTSV